MKRDVETRGYTATGLAGIKAGALRYVSKPFIFALVWDALGAKEAPMRRPAIRLFTPFAGSIAGAESE